MTLGGNLSFTVNPPKEIQISSEMQMDSDCLMGHGGGFNWPGKGFEADVLSGTKIAAFKS